MLNGLSALSIHSNARAILCSARGPHLFKTIFENNCEYADLLFFFSFLFVIAPFHCRILFVFLALSSPSNCSIHTGRVSTHGVIPTDAACKCHV